MVLTVADVHEENGVMEENVSSVGTGLAQSGFCGLQRVGKTPIPNRISGTCVVSSGSS